MRHLSAFLATVLCSWTLGIAPVWSQSADTGILGIISDASGAVVPGSTVTVTNASTGVRTQPFVFTEGTFGFTIF